MWQKLTCATARFLTGHAHQTIIRQEKSLSNVVVGLDIGTCFVRAVIGIVHEDNSVEIVDVAKRPSMGLLRILIFLRASVADLTAASSETVKVLPS